MGLARSAFATVLAVCRARLRADGGGADLPDASDQDHRVVGGRRAARHRRPCRCGETVGGAEAAGGGRGALRRGRQYRGRLRQQVGAGRLHAAVHAELDAHRQSAPLQGPRLQSQTDHRRQLQHPDPVRSSLGAGEHRRRVRRLGQEGRPGLLRARRQRHVVASGDGVLPAARRLPDRGRAVSRRRRDGRGFSRRPGQGVVRLDLGPAAAGRHRQAARARGLDREAFAARPRRADGGRSPVIPASS